MIEYPKFAVGENVSTKDADTMREFNAVLDRLVRRRVDQIEISGPLRKSKLAWKVATYQQPVLYRIVMLASGCALNWNAGNLLCAYLAARSLMETIAILLAFERELGDCIQTTDFRRMDELLTNRLFSTRDPDLISELPGTSSKNVLNFIDEMDKRVFPGTREYYDSLSERCHPNSFGHYQLFGRRDRETGTIRYSETHDLEGHLSFILLACVLLGLVERAQVSDIHHAAHPIVENG